MTHSLFWCGRKVTFEPGEMLACMLARECSDEAGFGNSPTGQIYGLFCGIGTCQGCLVKIKGRGIAEACLTPSRDGMEVESLQGATEPGPGATSDNNGG